MADIIHSELLKDKEVLVEIDRYKWLESEKVGHDIGIEKASRQWLELNASTWIARHSNKKEFSNNKPKKSFREL
jgi:hypothetical protein